jgi:hypothetical protein
MTTTTTTSGEFTLTMTEEERTQLLNWLEQRFKNKLVEEHRTRAPNYREGILHQEAILEDLINKLRPRK